MDWNTLIQKNFPAILSAISALVGAVIGFLGALLKEHLSRKADLQQKQLEWQKQYHDEHLSKPIIVFIDEQLQLMDDVYWASVSGTKAEIQDKLVEHRQKEGLITARVAAFGDTELSETFANLTRKFGSFRIHINKNELVEAYDVKKDAQEIAGTIIQRLWPQIPKC